MEPPQGSGHNSDQIRKFYTLRQTKNKVVKNLQDKVVWARGRKW